MPNNYSRCFSCPYKNQQHLGSSQQSKVNTPLSIRYGIKNGVSADELLVFQSPGIDEWQGNTVSGNREPIDSKSHHSAAARMRNSMRRKNVTKDDYDITEAVQCFPGKKGNNRYKQPCASSKLYCIQYLVNDLMKKQYKKLKNS